MKLIIVGRNLVLNFWNFMHKLKIIKIYIHKKGVVMDTMWWNFSGIFFNINLPGHSDLFFYLSIFKFSELILHSWESHSIQSTTDNVCMNIYGWSRQWNLTTATESELCSPGERHHTNNIVANVLIDILFSIAFTLSFCCFSLFVVFHMSNIHFIIYFNAFYQRC